MPHPSVPGGNTLLTANSACADTKRIQPDASGMRMPGARLTALGLLAGTTLSLDEPG